MLIASNKSESKEVRKIPYYSVILTTINKEKRNKFLECHNFHIDKMQENKNIYVAGSFSDEKGDLIIYEAESLDQVSLFVMQDPLVYNHASDYEVHEWNMSILKEITKSNNNLEEMYE
ncbi:MULTISPECIES: YciI family protein [unclassified Sporosarcina]|uniref:YciI family protein n=1 Tax=unclassified Sporosarcina TaxID=2647733 RepID=UPI00203DEB86|nr:MULTISPECIES: YciI family protein [unclassified Sporosarcina]GKV65911.1 hypothetical protein NCCP2331_20640 [Sporosarcina sp. NCCP-2331]GLB56089.1 hypothetical protein NCCP2378_18760 [Sporosarcina sp. NCCP-2378]